MPTERFYRLEEEKRRVISESVADECRQSLYGEPQISKIARNAHVSRGSLYTYFYDKEDMLEFTLKQTRESILEAGKKELVRNQGDYIGMMGYILECYLKLCKNDRFGRLLYLEQEKIMERYGRIIMRNETERMYMEWVYAHLDREKISCTKEEFWKLHGRSWTLLLQSVRRYLFHIETHAQIREEFKEMLSRINGI